MDETSPCRTGRGRPRSERARAAVLEAAAGLLTEGGMAAVTMEAIAQRAGVSKVTIYRWWPSRAHVMLESFFSRTRRTIDTDERATLAEGLTSQVGALIELFRDTESGPLMRDLAAAAQADQDIRSALETEWLRPRRQAGLRLLRRGLESGEIRADTDLEAALDQLFAPVYHRLLFGHAPLDDSLAPVLVAQLLSGIGERRG